MNIQIITANPDIRKFETCTISSLNAPKSFDMFDVNIIDISGKDIWRNDENSYRSINSANDFQSLKEIIKTSHKKVVIVLPQNMNFYYNYGGYPNSKYYKSIKLKDMLPSLTTEIFPLICDLDITKKLLYVNSITEIMNNTFRSAFVFRDGIERLYSVLAKSTGDNKCTVISNNRITITTLNVFESQEKLNAFLIGTGIYKEEKEPIPEWVESYSILDDEEQNKIIDECNEIINKAAERIIEAKAALSDNLEYKSILFENSDSLVNHVFMILEEILNCSLCDFEDIKKEDFLIRFDDVTFIGEIKGVTSNVKYEHVSQVDTNANIYLDRLEESGEKENIKQLLIINPKRNKPLSEREPINQDQINLAERNKSLIITTETLLKLFEKFRNKEVTTETIKDKFINEIGLLDLGVF